MITVDEIADLVRAEMRGKSPRKSNMDKKTSIDELGLSSLQLATIVFTLEEEHGIEVDPARAAGVRTLGDLAGLGNEALASAPR
ncbi:acyl carrier protein [Goodfellowiella coeruleoviolacea]|uniref:Acyl carrier protein n=1 Tax=Goodfellowiella coeruleoviolacea TaxID=334858 RepID=A0AAE3G9E2_9PSEU|nr:acyl carrier protein [Goodfellowiella coeruleoviolacea]MCP2163975.1 Acyl carrier protein [Goodfellowiella coeruleoviolacea]